MVHMTSLHVNRILVQYLYCKSWIMYRSMHSSYTCTYFILTFPNLTDINLDLCFSEPWMNTWLNVIMFQWTDSLSSLGLTRDLYQVARTRPQAFTHGVCEQRSCLINSALPIDRSSQYKCNVCCTCDCFSAANPDPNSSESYVESGLILHGETKAIVVLPP